MNNLIKTLKEFEQKIEQDTNSLASNKNWSESWKADRLHDVYIILHRLANKVYEKYEACMKEAEREEGE